MAKEVNKRVNIWLNEQGIDNNLKSIRAAIAKTANELNKLPIGSEEWLRKSEKLSKLKSIYSDVQKEIGATSRELDALNKRTMDQIITVGSLSAAAQAASSVLHHFVSATQEYVDAYATLDDAMTNVSKYTGLTREEVKQLNEEFQNMDTRTPTEKLNALAADAGRLGITSKEAIKDFVEAADIINVALGEDLGEDAVKEIGKLAEMFGTTETMGLRGAMLATGSAINTLAQSSSASERYLMDFTSRLAGAANQAQISQANILGFASVLDQNKQQVEMSATALQKLLMNMFTAPEKYARLAGISVKEFSDALKNDANEALLSFLDTLNKKGGLSELAPIFKELGLDGARASGVISVLAGKIDDVREAQATANAAFAEGNSVINEAAAVNGNAAAQLDKAKKAVQDAKAALGEELIPVITDLTKSSASGLKVLTAVVKFWTQHRVLLYSLVGAYGALRLAQKHVIAAQKEERALTLANTVAGKAYTLVTKLLAVAKAKLAANTEAAAVAQTELKAAFAATPWGAIIIAVTTLITGIGMLISRHRDAKKAVEEFNTECAREQAEAEYLFDKLKKAEKGTKDYEDALRELKEKYPEIIQKHLDEEGALRDVEQAYKDVIVQIKAKIAEQLKEEKRNAVTTKQIEEETDNIEKLRKKLLKEYSDSKTDDILESIKKQVAEGKEVFTITQNLNKEFGQIGVRGGIGKEIGNLVRAHREYSSTMDDLDKRYDSYITDANEELKIQKQLDELYAKRKSFDPFGSYGNGNQSPFVAGIDKQIDDLLDKLDKVQEAKKAVAEDPAEGGETGSGGSGSGSGATADKKTLTARQNFLKKLRQMEAKEQAESLEGWEKTKQEILNKYKELETEAKELYGKDSEEFKKVQDLKAQELSNALGKYFKTLTDASDKMMAEAKKMLDESNPDNKETPLIKAVFGEQQKWEEKMQAVRANIANLDEIIDTMEPGDDGWDDLLSTRQTLFEQLLTLQQDNAQAISNVIRQHTQSDTDFIKDQEEKLARARMSDHDRQVAEINELYNTKIEAKRKEIAALEKLLKENPENPENADIANQIEELKKLIEQLETLQGKEIAAVPKSGGQRSVWQQLAEFDWSKMSENWQSALDLMEQGLQEFANAAFDILSSISQMQADREQAELDRYVAAQDERSKALKRQLEDGLISQKYYDAQLLKMEKEKDEKEKKMKHEQFERERAANIAKVLIEGGLAVAMAFAQYGWPWGLIPAALSTAQTAAQTAMMAAQANPYAKGSYIRGKQIALMGEEGDEWVASNKLLRDKKTAGIIEALDQYQKGNRNALAAITFPTPTAKTLSQAVPQYGRSFAPSNQTTNNYYQNADSPELLNEIRMLRKYMEDPNNRRSYISRKMMVEFDERENELKKMARL